MAALVPSVKYCPPEVVQELESNHALSPMITVDGSVDIWAIGIIVFELLTGERVFPTEGLTPEQAQLAAMDAIKGLRPLPWEPSAVGFHIRVKALRGLRRLVLPCLARAPQNRPTASALSRSLEYMLDAMVTRSTWSRSIGSFPKRTMSCNRSISSIMSRTLSRHRSRGSNRTHASISSRNQSIDPTITYSFDNFPVELANSPSDTRKLTLTADVPSSVRNHATDREKVLEWMVRHDGEPPCR